MHAITKDSTNFRQEGFPRKVQNIDLNARNYELGTFYDDEEYNFGTVDQPFAIDPSEPNSPNFDKYCENLKHKFGED